MKEVKGKDESPGGAESESEPEPEPTLVPMPELKRLAGMSAQERQAYLGNVTSRYHTSVQLFDSTSGEWPTCTDEMCRWCMHRFEWFPVGIPLRFDESRRKMILAGYFCSFACALAFTVERPQSHYAEHTTWLAWLARRGFGIERIRRAPPREMLNRMSIEEFRAASSEASYDATVPQNRSQLALFAREQEIMVVRSLVDPHAEAQRVEAQENALHAETAAAASALGETSSTTMANKRRRKAAADTATTSSTTTQSGDHPPMMPAQWVRTIRADETKKREETGILRMLGAKRKT